MQESTHPETYTDTDKIMHTKTGTFIHTHIHIHSHTHSIFRVIPKTQKMVLDASLLNTQHYKVRIKGKVEQSRERSSALPYTLV